MIHGFNWFFCVVTAVVNVLFFLKKVTKFIIVLLLHSVYIGVNGLVFGDRGELYIQVGGNTNGGVPGKISGTQLQKDNYYSSATLVAHIYDSNFNGTITYDAIDDGTPIRGTGIEIFCSGNRNPFGIVLHSNGYLYGTDNGSNNGWGKCVFFSFLYDPFRVKLTEQY